MAALYINCYREDEIWIDVSLETFVVLFACHWSRDSNINLVFIRGSETGNCNVVRIKKKCEIFSRKCNMFCNEAEVVQEIQNCGCPILKLSTNHYIAGICAVIRHLFKKCEEGLKLLGFRHRSLMACAEVSAWTKFCEVDVINTVKYYISNEDSSGFSKIPDDILKYEAQLGQAVCSHNVSKKTQKSVSAKKDHDFAEGAEMTVADIIIFANISLVMQSIPEKVRANIPRTVSWYKRMLNIPQVQFVTEKLQGELIVRDFGEQFEEKCRITDASTANLYIRSEERVKSKGKNYTSQEIIYAILETLNTSGIKPMNSEQTCYGEADSFWDKLPTAAHPIEGDLPNKRIEHKCRQLENLANAVFSIAKDGDIIVDFCSGGGHLGIVLAVKLPACRIILVENKEMSVEKALRRMQTLKLDNCSVYQCNLRRFKGPFNVGVALHACGVATDLVMKACIDRRASFVICPCCYGAIRDTPIIRHPLSEQFSIMTKDEYTTLCHAADQTHYNCHKQSQGKYCMGLVDTDRLLRAQSANYKVSLCTLRPEDCTQKNNLLIGTPVTR